MSQDTGGTSGVGDAATGGMTTDGGAASGGGTTTFAGGGTTTFAGGGTTFASDCDAATANCPKCSTTDAPKCGDPTDAGTPLLICEKPLVGFIQADICNDEKHCEPGVNHCVVCEANETHCVADINTGELTDGKRCNGNQTGWDLYTCRNRLCIPDAGTGTPDICDSCVEKSTICADSTRLRKCVGGEWQTELCASGCQLSQAGNPAQCIIN